MKWLTLFLSLLIGSAHAQQAGCVNGTPCVQTNVFLASAIATLSASTVSSEIAFPASGSALTLLITNNSLVSTVYVLPGGTSVVATLIPPSTPILPGQTIALPQGLNTNIAAVTVSGTASLTIQSGTGVPVLVYGQVSILGGITVTPRQPILVPLDIATVTTANTAVTALNAGHASAGGWLVTSAASGICVDQVTTAGTVTGTPSTTACVGQNVPYYIIATPNAVSVNSTVGLTKFAGVGEQ
jgi:hypothetical protein